MDSITRLSLRRRRPGQCEQPRRTLYSSASWITFLVCVGVSSVQGWTHQGAVRTAARGRARYHSFDSNKYTTLPPSPQKQRTTVCRHAKGENANEGPKAHSQKQTKSKQPPRKKKPGDKNTPKLSKQDLVQAVGQEMKAKRQQQTRSESSSITDSSSSDGTAADASTDRPPALLDRINPFKAGQSLRRTIGTAITSIQTSATPDAARQSKYYLDDRFLDVSDSTSRKALDFASSATTPRDDFVPEVLVVGATGAVGQLIVRQLLAGNSRVGGPKVRVRVLVRDLYTSTLNLFGTGVTYCPGDLTNPDSLEYACTDVDKLIFCASTPRPDEEQFQAKFQEFVTENSSSGTSSSVTLDNAEWEQLDSILAVRAALAEQVDVVGMQNLVRAYQHVRHSDYGTSQAAKRSLFKFQDRPEDFTLFDIDNDDGDEAKDDDSPTETARDTGSAPKGDNTVADTKYDYDDEDEDDPYADSSYETDEYADEYAEYETNMEIEKRSDANAVKTQSRWIRNQFEHGVFVGRIPQSAGSTDAEAAIVSSRLRSRDDPENGIELGPSFAGFVCRICSDGSTYEAFVRTGAYYTHGIEYVCEFSTRTKSNASNKTNKSYNKFTTLRLPFENFKPVQRKSLSETLDSVSVPLFRGRDVRHLGFRYRSASNAKQTKVDVKGVAWNRFYLAMSYIKVYRSQPEPEFVYLSDARIPPVVQDGMIRHDARQLVGTTASNEMGSYEGIRWLDDSVLDGTSRSSRNTLASGRSPEETYFKYRGEEILKNSGLSYAIVRVSDFNESPSGSEETIDLSWIHSDEMEPVSRADVAKVCVSALLDPHALNKSFYVSKKSGGSSSADLEQDMSSKFAALPMDQIA